jgi:PD-(D/E)XK endonuclease
VNTKELPQEPRKLGNKTKGNLVAMEFMCECTRRGGIVSVPLADDHPYDLIVDSGARLVRVQVKKANCDGLGRWSCNASRRKMNYARPAGWTASDNGENVEMKSSRIVPYSPSEIDCLVTFVRGSWYFFADIHLLRNNKWINPDKPNPDRDRWDRIGLPVIPIE